MRTCFLPFFILHILCLKVKLLIYRSDLAWKKVFADAGLKLLKEEVQEGFPEGLYPVKTYVIGIKKVVRHTNSFLDMLFDSLCDNEYTLFSDIKFHNDLFLLFYC